ncbi:MAG: AAA family ATPase [Gemmatimonadetes bacterium]|nr:AAA family ATPase [Gemmatimonadota bacterium]
MTTTSNAKPLELTVSNFGPIAEASIDLRPMSVFVGPSNTGKSYTAALIYALHRFFNGYSVSVEHRRVHARSFWPGGFSIVPPRDLNLSERDIASIYNWMNETLPDPLSNETPPDTEIADHYELPESIAVLVRPVLNSIAHLSGDLDSEIVRCFGVEKTKNLVRYPDSGGTGFSLRGNISTETGRNSPFEYSVTVTEQGAKIDTSIPHTMPLRIGPNSISIKYLPMRLLASQAQLVNNNLAIALLGGLASDIVSDTVGPLARPAHYLPADRAGVMHAHQVAVRGLIAGASRTALRPDSPMPVLSGVLGDFMEQLVALADSSRREQDEDYDHLAQNLEQTLLRGAVRVEQSPINYPSFVFQPNGWKRDLPLMNASSMVSELAPVVLYLRHVVQPGDLLIIEEPESHLHPAMQVEFIRQLAAAVQSGVRILITTHSEWVLEELANLVRLSELPEERRDGIDDEDIVLSPDQVGAWFFEPSSEGNGSTVRGIALDTESATFPAGFGLVTEALYNRWSEISTRIEEG